MRLKESGPYYDEYDVYDTLDKTQRVPLEFSSSSKLSDDLDSKLFDMTMNGITIESTSDDYPIPWDADISIEGNNLVIKGHVGTNGFGSCEVKLPLSKVNDCYNITVDTLSEYHDEVMDLLRENNLI